MWVFFFNIFLKIKFYIVYYVTMLKAILAGTKFFVVLYLGTRKREWLFLGWSGPAFVVGYCSQFQ